MSAKPSDVTVRFSFDGGTVEAQANQSVAAALLARGVRTLTRSSKYGRPRGVYCAGGYCPNCLLRIDGEPNVRSCLVRVADGMVVESEHSLSRHLAPKRLVNVLSPLFPVGFQYRYFKRQSPLWRIWESQLRKNAADTSMPSGAPTPPAERWTAELLVVGGGPAGIAAAAAGAQAGISTVIATRRERLGGRLRPQLDDGTAQSEVQHALASLLRSEHVRIVAPGTVVAAFESTYWIDARTHLIELRAPRSVLATGAYERALVFKGNDMPGVMLTTALRRLALEDRVLDGSTAIIATTDDSAYSTAAELVDAGVGVKAVLDVRSSIDDQAHQDMRDRGIPVITSSRIEGVHRRRRGFTVSTERGETFSCDFVGMSGGWQPADELRYVLTSDGQALVEGERADEAQRFVRALTPVGGVTGTRDAAKATAEGDQAVRGTAHA
jgi:NADPH-dependent 2,4-dienoyl-CoA reductase/sulfur reductase-like enzyme